MREKVSETIDSFFIWFGILNYIYFFLCLIIYKIVVNFTPFFLLTGTFFILFGMFKIKVKRNNLNKNLKIVIRFINVFLILLLISFVLVEGGMAYNAAVNDNKKPDYVMLLGCGIYGKNMLLPQYQRAETGLEYIKKHPEVKVIVSGGKGSGEAISEAEAYKVFLVNHGVKAENIIKEEKSKTTMENMKYTRDILKKIDGRENIRIAVVTSNYHILRAKFLAERCGFKAEGIPAPVSALLLPNFSVREYFGVIKSFFLDK